MKVLLSFFCLLLGLPVYAVNLLQNSSFELGTAYWGIAEGGNMDYPMYPDIFLTNSPAHSGNYSLVCRQQTVGGNCFGTFPVRLKASTPYSLSMWGYGAIGVQQRVYITNGRDVSPNLGGVDGPTFTNTLTLNNTWQRFWTNWVTPAGSNTAYFIRIDPIAFGGTLFLTDDWQLEEVGSIFDPPTLYAPCADVETAIIFPSTRGANMFWTNETVSVPIVTFNSSANTVSATNVWALHNYRFDLLQSNSFSATIGSGFKVTNTLNLTPATNIIGTYRVTTWVNGYEAPSIAEVNFGVIPRPIPMSWPPTNSHFGSMIAFQQYWMTNAWNIGLKWARTLSVGRTNSLLAGQFLRFRTVTTGSPSGLAQLTNGPGDSTPAWATNAGIQAGLAMATNIGFSILGTFEYLRDGGGSVNEGMTWAIDTSDWTNWTTYPSNYYRFAAFCAAAYFPYIKHYELGNEFDTEGQAILFNTNGSLIVPSRDWACMVISNAWTAIKSNFPSITLIPINAFTPDTFHKASNYLGSAFFTDKILSSHVYGGGEHGAERLWTNVGEPFQITEHWQTESGTTSKSERQNFPFEEINQGTPGVAGSHSFEGSDPVQRSAEVIRNYVMWSKWPTHVKWMYHLVDEKRSVNDPQSHSLFDWDGAISMRAVSIAALAQLFEGSYGRSNLVSNAFTNGAFAFNSSVDGGKFARGTTNCPLVVFWGTNDLLCYRAHINLATNQFNLYDMYGNSQERVTNIVFSNQPWIVEGQAGVLSNTVWNGVLITATNADTIPPKVVFTKHPTHPGMTNDAITWRWAARDNLVAQYSQGTDSAVTNLLKHRYKLAGYDANFSAYRSDAATEYSPNAFIAKYTNVPAGSYTMYVEVQDTAGNVGSNSFNWVVMGAQAPPAVPAGPSGSRLRIGIAP